MPSLTSSLATFDLDRHRLNHALLQEYRNPRSTRLLPMDYRSAWPGHTAITGPRNPRLIRQKTREEPLAHAAGLPAAAYPRNPHANTAPARVGNRCRGDLHSGSDTRIGGPARAGQGSALLLYPRRQQETPEASAAFQTQGYCKAARRSGCVAVGDGGKRGRCRVAPGKRWKEKTARVAKGLGAAVIAGTPV